jgi:antitoxin (DNA-binding transcriptional repressor) of toxin-antitoxin stability system
MTVMNVSVEEIKHDPESVLHRVREGETVIITERDQPVAEIRPIESVRRPRPFGLAAGAFVVPDDFDDPLPEATSRYPHFPLGTSPAISGFQDIFASQSRTQRSCCFSAGIRQRSRRRSCRKRTVDPSFSWGFRYTGFRESA